MATESLSYLALAPHEIGPVNIVHPARPWIRALSAVSGATPSETIAAIEAAGYALASTPATNPATGYAVLPSWGMSRIAIKAFGASGTIADNATFDIPVFGLNMLQEQTEWGYGAKSWVADHLLTLRFTMGTAAVPSRVCAGTSLTWADAVAVQATGKALAVPAAEVKPVDAVDNAVATAVFDGLSPQLLMLQIPSGANCLVQWR